MRHGQAADEQRDVAPARSCVKLRVDHRRRPSARRSVEAEARALFGFERARARRRCRCRRRRCAGFVFGVSVALLGHGVSFDFAIVAGCALRSLLRTRTMLPSSASCRAASRPFGGSGGCWRLVGCAPSRASSSICARAPGRCCCALSSCACFSSSSSSRFSSSGARARASCAPCPRAAPRGA